MTLLLGSDTVLGKFLNYRLDGEIDIEPVPDKVYDIVYCCDKKQSVIDVLNTLSCERLIFFSDYSIYNDNIDADHYEWQNDPFEEDVNNSSITHHVELAITSKFNKYNIIRLPDQVIGTGIKMNEDEESTLDTEQSIYDLDELFTDVSKVIRAEIHVCNFTSQSTNNNIKTRYSWLFPEKSTEGFTLSREYIKTRCERYLKVLHSDKNLFTIADKCWTSQNESKVFLFLQNLEITNVEIDLFSRFQNWGKVTLYSVRDLANELRNNNIKIWGFNNNFTDVTSTLFNDKTETILNHTLKLIDCCTITGARRINFDNPEVFKIEYSPTTMYNVREKAAKAFFQFLQKVSTYRELSKFKDIILSFPHINDIIQLQDTFVGVLNSTNSENIKMLLNNTSNQIDANLIGTIRIEPKNNKDVIKVAVKKDKPINKVTIMTEKVYKLDIFYNMIADTIYLTNFDLEP